MSGILPPDVGYAVSRASSQAIAEYFEAGGSADDTSAEGQPLLHLVQSAMIGHRHAPAVRAVLAGGPRNVDVLWFGWTPLHRATSRSLTSLSKQLDIITMLVEAGADVNARISTDPARNERSGRTPLLLAAAHTWRIGGSRKYAIIRLLLTLGARIDICDDYGGTVDSILAVHPLLKYYDDEEFWYQKRDHRKAMTLVADVRSAGGTWARYIHEPRVRLDVLRQLCCRGRATPQTYFSWGCRGRKCASAAGAKISSRASSRSFPRTCSGTPSGFGGATATRRSTRMRTTSE